MLELLDRTFRIYRDSFVMFITATALVTVPVSVISLLSSLNYLNRAPGFSSALTNSRNNTAALSQAMNGYFGSLLWIVVVGVVLAFIQGVLLHSVLTYMASERNLGRSVTIGGAFSAGGGGLGTLPAGAANFYRTVPANRLYALVLRYTGTSRRAGYCAAKRGYARTAPRRRCIAAAFRVVSFRHGRKEYRDTHRGMFNSRRAVFRRRISVGG